ncbi:AEC family transporter [Agilicoccus flavus]|uniref:AEC family transporter n=1 Tax=Agilicoccus flavus TaxID=2775968 RepID=UPI001CF6F452|nr:AEC family transporter [Agilicoccus flavus]
MGQVFDGFITVGAVIALGALLAHVRLVDEKAQSVLLTLSFFVASPALMLLTIGEADVHQVLSPNLVASAAGVLIPGAIYLALARWRWHRDAGEATIGALSCTYVNAGNLGIPIAAYVLGDAALVAPTLLMQLLVMQPLAMTVLDRHTRGPGQGVGRMILAALSNPLTVGSLLGLVLALTGVTLPTAIRAPVDLVGHFAVPAMLIAYGIALRLGPGLGAGGSRAELVTTTMLKLFLQPLTAYAVARFGLGVEGLPLLAIVVTSALPTAQNIFVHASRYGRSTTLARDTILLTTAGSVPVILAATALLG